MEKKLKIHDKINYRSWYSISIGKRVALPYKNFDAENQQSMISRPYFQTTYSTKNNAFTAKF